MLTGKHYKNENAIKDMITRGHRNGTCDNSGRSMKTSGRMVALPRVLSSVAKTYVCRNGKMVLKNA